jgi:O-antigen/teichoic acid export membrane protein
MPSATRSRLPAWLVGGGVIAVAMGVMNLSTYGFNIIAARLLGPSEYGVVAALLGLLLVVNVVSLGLQATAARRVSASSEPAAHIEAEALSASYRSALGLGLLCLLAVPLVSATLRLGWPTATLVAVTAVPLTVMGGQAGLLQGERRWLPLAAIYLAMGLGRLLCGAGGVLVQPTAFGAMTGVAVGSLVPTAVGWLALRHPSRGRAAAGGLRGTTSGGWARGGLLREVAGNSHALLAFFALANADVLIARGVLTDHVGGLYAGGLILAKAVLFLPQFIVVIAFPSMSASGARAGLHLRGLAVILGLGVVATAAAWALERLAVLFVGGEEYAELQPVIWAFAAVGTLLAMIQLMVYNVVARQDRRSIYAVWASLAVLVALSPLVGSVTDLLTAVLAAHSCVLVALLLLGRTPGAAR